MLFNLRVSCYIDLYVEKLVVICAQIIVKVLSRFRAPQNERANAVCSVGLPKFELCESIFIVL